MLARWPSGDEPSSLRPGGDGGGAMVAWRDNQSHDNGERGDGRTGGGMRAGEGAPTNDPFSMTTAPGLRGGRGGRGAEEGYDPLPAVSESDRCVCRIVDSFFWRRVLSRVLAVKIKTGARLMPLGWCIYRRLLLRRRTCPVLLSDVEIVSQ